MLIQKIHEGGVQSTDVAFCELLREIKACTTTCLPLGRSHAMEKIGSLIDFGLCEQD